MRTIESLGKNAKEASYDLGIASTTEKNTALEFMAKALLNNKKENDRKQKLAEIEAAQKLAGELKGKEITIKAKTGENGKLFGAITSKDVAELIKTQYKIEIDKKKIVMDTIKLAGGYDIEIKLYPEVSTKMKVVIVPQE